MQVGVIGINYKTASLQSREALAKKENWLIRQCLSSCSIVCLSTCNRFELYFSLEDLAPFSEQLLQLLLQSAPGLSRENVYTYFDLDCFTHLARVAAGLDSAVFAESDIQRQVKSAYRRAAEPYTLSSSMHFLFQKSLKVAKLLRRNDRIYSRVPDMNTVIWETIQNSFHSKQNFEVSLVGYSEINKRIMRFFHQKPKVDLFLYTRYASNAKLQFNEDCTVLPWSEIQSALHSDVIISAAKRENPIFNAAFFRNINCKKLPLIFDLSVPRNVDPGCIQAIRNLDVYNIDELDRLVQRRQLGLEFEVAGLEKLLKLNTRKLREIYHTRARKGLLLKRHLKGESLGLGSPIYVSGF